MTDPRLTDDPTPDDDEGSDVLPSEDDAETSPEPTTEAT